jgi:hypothetical protein
MTPPRVSVLSVLCVLSFSLFSCNGGRPPGEVETAKPATLPAPKPAETAPARPPDVDPADIRPPAVAGQFYPGDKAGLEAALDKALAAAPKPALDKPVRAIIVPHAGYAYSAACAAKAFKAIEGGDFDRVVLIGCPHRVAVRGGAVWAKGAWDTPLGRVHIDEAAARAMIDASAGRLRDGRDPHKPDHCLEVELPFLQKVLKPGFRVVPILFHAAGEADVDAFEAALKAVCDARTVVVVSTDLSHFPSLKDAAAADARTLASWKTLDNAAIAEVAREQMGAGIASLDCTMCGQDAVVGLVRAAKALGITALAVVGSATSAEVSRDEKRVVGYGAAVLTGDAPASALAREPGAPAAAPGTVSAAAGRKLVAIARRTIELAAAGKIPPALTEDDPELQARRGCFVTLHKAGALRGCIGCFGSEEPLYRTVQRMAVASSQEDTRFPAVVPSEVAAIDVEISVLSEIVPCPDWKTIVLGTHGVIVRKGGRSGVFLPQVATETGWTIEEFLGHLARDKAGIGEDGWRDPDARLFTFTVQIIREEKGGPPSSPGR